MFPRHTSSRTSTSLFLTLACLALVLGLSTTPAYSQAATGTLTGTITDQQGAAIPGVEIRVTEPTTSSTRTVVTNDVGRYTIVGIPPGTYDITVAKVGFTASKFSAQKLEIGQVLTLDVSLQVGVTTTTVEVTARAGAELQTLNATVGTTISNDALQLLPNLGRDASTLSVLQVGVSLTGNVAGAATDQNKFQLDGGNNSDDMAGTNTTYTPGNGYAGGGATGGTPTGVMPTPIESIEEVKIGTIGQGADFNGAAGSSVQMVTKRGTNAFHGALYEFYFGSNVGAANLWRNNHVLGPDGKATPLPATHRNRYGGAVGGPMTPKFWGGKTYFFANYEGSKFPNVVSFERGTPTKLFRAGVIKATASGAGFNLNPFPVTVDGVTYAPAQCNGANCDPRGLGINPTIQKIWNTMPLPNDPTYTAGSAAAGLVDGINAQGYLGTLALPQESKFFTGRIDHDFGEKWKFFGSYRYYKFTQLVNTQTDIGGLLSGATQGQYKSFAPRPVQPSYYVAGLTTTLSPSVTNDFRFSYLRNFWQWSTQAGPPQFAGLGGAVEIGGESLNALIPYNVDSQDVRQRFWDGHDYFLSDNVSKLKGHHLFQFGGSYQRIFDYHGRDDNGVGINTSIVYHVNGSNENNNAYVLPTGYTGALSNYVTLFNMATGVLNQTQVMYSRSGSKLTLNPLGTPGFDQSVIPSYDLYFNDTWHVRPSLTLSYGLAWNLAMPPYEINGKQVLMVDNAGKGIDIQSYMNQRSAAALQGQVFEPTLGFATLPNSNGGLDKYPYKPFYGGFSPHVSLAWNPKANGGLMGKILGNGQTVIRGGYGRIYGRLNGVDLMLVPLLGPGLLQAVSCINPQRDGTCPGVGAGGPSTNFRIGVDGNTAQLPPVTQTLPQPFIPGIAQNGATLVNSPAADGSQLDPKFKPNHSEQFTFTLQRSFGSKFLMEAGYIGRTIKNEFQEINIDAVPWMTTLNGQSFAQAFSAIWPVVNAGAVPAAQPFFEAAMGGPTSPYCTGFANCTAAIASKENANIKNTVVYTMWLNMNKAAGWTLGRTMLAAPALKAGDTAQQLSGAFDYINSLGHGNYNAGFFSFTARDFHGFTLRSNMTYGRALGTGSVTQASSSITVPNPYDFDRFGTYGTQPFDVKMTYSLLMLYQVPYYRSQKGIVGKFLGGWVVAPLFTARSGLPQRVSVGGNSQIFGEIYSGQSSNYVNAAGNGPFTGGNSAQYNVPIQTGAANPKNVASTGTTGMNIFADPVAVYNQFRRPVLGTDTGSGGAGVIRGFPFWNLDATISKDIRVTESIGATLSFQFVNILNHFTPADPTTNIDTPTSFGVVTNQYTTPNGAANRALEFGLRIRF
ncbi:MAG TPA: carboxypeptidase-like regulatory domain-containing protein [Bryobacteraceae bacterium]|nr:carboxypeptidase-like regulatory domain-containing protein [Bryobacteraceae bacterium]